MAAKDNPQQFVKECLEEHNKLRAQHGCPPLKINAELTSLAQNWAENLAKRDVMEHRPKNKYGENIYFSSGQVITGDRAVKMWYAEIEKYDFAKSQFGPGTGHFTQVIWRDTKEVGIAYAKKKDKIWVVANYNPPGNVQGQFKEMVPPKK